MAKRALSLMLALWMLFSLFCLPASAASQKYGSLPILVGYADADYMAERILAEIHIPAGSDHRTVIRTVYDWIIRNCDRYSPDGRVYFNESTLSADSSKYLAEANTLLAAGEAVIRPELTNEYGGPSADSNYNIAVYSYEMMMYRAGNSSHFASLLALLLGHLGYDCRIISGERIDEDGTRTEHKWNFVLVNNYYYWLDVQMDHGIYEQTGSISHKYFMITGLTSWEQEHSWNRTYSSALSRNASQITGRYNSVSHTHDLVYRAAVSATCTTEGRLAYYECTSCGKCFRDRQATQQIDPKDLVTAPMGHDWGEWVTVTEATWESDGTRRRTCQNDQRHTETETFSGLYNPYVDVPNDAYYLRPVLWARENGITSGTDATHFSPDKICTRAQVVTFLWRAAGSPEPVSSVSPFSDVSKSSYYYKAVLWAVEQGITSGMGNGRFAPDDTCTRAQVVTFLYRASGSPAVYSGSNPFTDVRSGDYYYNAVRWAVQNGITSGVDSTHFGPGTKCSRAQVVTFLYRAEA